MRRLILLSFIALFVRCASAPPPAAPPAVEPPAPVAQESVIGSVRVTATSLNVRRDPSADGEVLRQVKKGDTLSVLQRNESWTKVRFDDGESGWVASRFVSDGAAAKTKAKSKKGTKCPADSDFAFVTAPMLSFSDSSAHGIVVVDATVDVHGNVIGTRVVSNSTGDEALGVLTEREIQKAKFAPPIRNCAPRAFIFTYRRTY